METATAFSVLEGQEFMSLTTFRRNGQAVSTPVWFAEEDGRLVIVTSPTSGKVKRIRNNSMVTVAPCTFNGKVIGPAVQAQARILPPENCAQAEQLLTRKYGWKKRLFELTAVFRRPKDKQAAYLEITSA
jgi:PPOX class probable F420-dependent enzyme